MSAAAPGPLSAAYGTNGAQDSDAMSISSGSDASHSDMDDSPPEGGPDAGSNPPYDWYCCQCGFPATPVNHGWSCSRCGHQPCRGCRAVPPPPAPGRSLVPPPPPPEEEDDGDDDDDEEELEEGEIWEEEEDDDDDDDDDEEDDDDDKPEGWVNPIHLELFGIP